MNWYLGVLKKYAVFSGRARRKEYWTFVLINIIIAFVLGFIDGFIGFDLGTGVGVLGGIYSLFVLIPTLAVTVRRYHDTGRSAWALLLPLIPLVGWIIALVYLLTDSQPGENEYGPNPKEDGNAGGYTA